ncbi:MAG: hypothetical protein K2X27_27280 [Candidatus Obscuribacterales bacterium]|nr:hypothetical protein [Candidatus Obscuribacterales bacterium]
MFRQLLVSYILMMLALVNLPGAYADNPQQIEVRLASGGKAVKSDIEDLQKALNADQSSAYNRMLLGEVFASLGLYALADEQFSAAEKIQKNLVLNQFKRVFEFNYHLPLLLCAYVEAKYPDDPAVILFQARRDIAVPQSRREERAESISRARANLAKAAQMQEPWPGTLSLLAMLDYNEARMEGRLSKLNSAIELADQELKLHPKEAMALKVKILTLNLKGERPSGLIPLLQQALQVSPRDDAMNILLAKALIEKKNYKDALYPALLGLFAQKDAASLSDARSVNFELIKKLPREDFTETINAVLSQYADRGVRSRGFRATLMRIRLADLFALAGDDQEACRQLEYAVRMHPFFRSSVAYDLACRYLKQHQYNLADVYLEMACHLGKNDADSNKYRLLKERVERVITNKKRDIALRVKLALVAKKAETN